MLVIFDFGYELVKVCVEVNIFVVLILGVIVNIIVLCVFGLLINKFIFIGFLFIKIKLWEEQLEKLFNLLEIIVLYEFFYKLL